jgi:hypothetical protein
VPKKGQLNSAILCLSYKRHRASNIETQVLNKRCGPTALLMTTEIIVLVLVRALMAIFALTPPQ